MLEDGEYRAVELARDADGTVWGHSPLLGLDIYAPSGEGRLRLYDPVKGEWLRNLPESEAALAESEAALAESEAALAATEADLAATEVERDLERQARLAAEAERDAAQERIRRLEEQLRRQQDS